MRVGGANKGLVKIAKIYENVLGRQGDVHFCVSHAFGKNLLE